jgi:hypothetical protein
MTVHEMAALQGVPRNILDRMLATTQTPADVGAALGDAMSINVLMRILPRALASAGLIADGQCTDIWKSSTAIAGVMPDALYLKKGCAML